jgi:hypothetical protein
MMLAILTKRILLQSSKAGVNLKFVGLNCGFSRLKGNAGLIELMEKRALVAAVALILPLALYGIPYAYAASTQLTYVVRSDFPPMDSGSNGYVKVQCASTTDFTQHYSTSFPEQLPVHEVHTINSAGFVSNTGDNPNGWIIVVHNLGAATFADKAEIICQSPVTVAGIGVPQFGSLYVAIALGAVVYFVMSRRLARRPTMSAIVNA